MLKGNRFVINVYWSNKAVLKYESKYQHFFVGAIVLFLLRCRVVIALFGFVQPHGNVLYLYDK